MKTTDKVCPLSLSRTLSCNASPRECIGNACAWWNDFAEDCSIQIVACVVADDWLRRKEKKCWNA